MQKTYTLKTKDAASILNGSKIIIRGKNLSEIYAKSCRIARKTASELIPVR